MQTGTVWKLMAGVVLLLVATGGLIAQVYLMTVVDSFGRPLKAIERLEQKSQAAWQPMIEAFERQKPKLPSAKLRGQPEAMLEALLASPYVRTAYYYSPEGRLWVAPSPEQRVPPFQVDLAAWRPELFGNAYAPRPNVTGSARLPAIQELLVQQVVDHRLFKRSPSTWMAHWRKGAGVLLETGNDRQGWAAFELDRARFEADGEAVLERLGLLHQLEWRFSGTPSRDRPAELPMALRDLSLEPTRHGAAAAWVEVLDQELRWVFAWFAVVLVAFYFCGRQLGRFFQERTQALAQSNFVSGVSHELRTPLTTIKMYAEMIEQGVVKEPGQQLSYVRTIRQESDRLARLVDNVLDYAIMARKTKEYQFEQASARELIEAAVASVEGPLAQAGMRVEVIVPEGLTLRVDRDAIVQALVNLIANAIKYAPNEKVIMVSASESERQVRLAVRDFGPGIARREQRLIFRPFYRTGSELTRQTSGAGLGLALVQEYARAHGGKAELESRLGEGATFSLVLPRRTTR